MEVVERMWPKKANRGKNIGSCGKIFGTKKEIVEKRKLWKKFQILKNPKKANRGRALKGGVILCYPCGTSAAFGILGGRFQGLGTS